MGNRRKSRQFALQLLYAYDMYPLGFEASCSDFWEMNPCSSGVKKYAERIVQGVIEKKIQIDSLIESRLVNWKLSRMSTLDRNILRIAVYEFSNESEVPHPVIINEAIEIAKKFGDGDSGHFVNGVLDAIRKSLK